MAKTYTETEVAANIMEFARRKIQAFELEIVKLRKREELRASLHKAIIPPHRHDVGQSVGAGIEDIPAAKLSETEKAVTSPESTPPSEETPGEESPGSCPACGGPLMELGSLGRRKHSRCRDCGMGSSTMAKEELCKDCGQTHLGKTCKSGKCSKCSCSPCKCAAKAELKTQAKTVKAPGSGGQIKRGPKALKKSALEKLAEFDGGAMGMPGTMKGELEKHRWDPTEYGVCKTCGKHHSSHPWADEDWTVEGKTPRDFKPSEKEKNKASQPKNMEAVGEHLKAEPPMAKPPSGVNMSTKVPVSKPKLPPGPKLGTMKGELEKGVMADIARRNSPPVPGADLAPAPAKMPTQEQHGARASTHQAALQGAFQPKAPVVSGLELDRKRPGIFGKIGNK